MSEEDLSSINTEEIQTSLVESGVFKQESLKIVKKRLKYMASLLKKFPSPQGDGCFFLVVKDKKPQSWHKLSKEKMSIGRSKSSDLPLVDLSVSREHCILEKDDGHWVIKDNDSSNGIYVNSKKVGKRELCDGDLVRVGDFELIFVRQYDEI